MAYVSLNDYMLARLKERALSGKTYHSFAFLGDTRLGYWTKKNSSNPEQRNAHTLRAFRELLIDIATHHNPLFIVHGGDIIGRGSSTLATQYRNEILCFYKMYGIPVITIIGNHEYYNGGDMKWYRTIIGPNKRGHNFNFMANIPGLETPVTLVVINDAKPHVDPQRKWNGRNFQYYYFTAYDAGILNMYLAQRPTYENIVLAMHVPPRAGYLLDYVYQKYGTGEKAEWYKALWTLGPQSTNRFYRTVENSGRAEDIDTILTCHIHDSFTFYGRKHLPDTQYVVSGTAGAESTPTYQYHILRAVDGRYRATEYSIKYSSTLPVTWDCKPKK